MHFNAYRLDSFPCNAIVSFNCFLMQSLGWFIVENKLCVASVLNSDTIGEERRRRYVPLIKGCLNSQPAVRSRWRRVL